jgi:hypothetical protein
MFKNNILFRYIMVKKEGIYMVVLFILYIVGFYLILNNDTSNGFIMLAMVLLGVLLKKYIVD